MYRVKISQQKGVLPLSERQRFLSGIRVASHHSVATNRLTKRSVALCVSITALSHGLLFSGSTHFLKMSMKTVSLAGALASLANAVDAAPVDAKLLEESWAQLQAQIQQVVHTIIDYPLPIWQKVAVAWFGYVVLRIFWRQIEAKRLVDAPGAKGWQLHKAQAEAVHKQFTNFLAKRKPGQMVSINRSKSGHSDSNRTIAADYKKESLKVDVSQLDGVIAIDHAAGLMHIEPGLPMDEMARIAIAYGVVPLVVLEFPGITAGGAVCGGGIESSSHKYGCFYDTVEEVDIIVGDGRWLKGVSRTKEPDLFAGLSVSYGTQGIITRIAIRVEPAPKYVHVRYLHMDGMESATTAMTSLANAQGEGAPAFVDGVALGPKSAMVVVGDGCNEPPAGVPYMSLRNSRTDPWFFWHLTDIARLVPALAGLPGDRAPRKAKSDAAGGADGDAWRGIAGHSEYVTLDDYLFRFDRGAFWMARHGLAVFYGSAAYNPNENRLAGPASWIRFKYSWLATTRQLYRMLHLIGDVMLARTYIVQDYVMPGPKEATKLSEYTADADEAQIGIWPLWVCPVRMVTPRHKYNAGFGFPVQKTKHNELFFNVGVYGLPRNGKPFDPVEVNKGLEDKATELGGRKMLYAQSFYSQDEFWSLFDKPAYDAIRTRYGGADVFPSIDKKLLLGKRMEEMKGEVAVSFFDCAWSMAGWYASLWQEILVPRSLHAWLNIQFTGMSQYRAAPGAEEATAAAAKAHAEAHVVKPAAPTPGTARRRRASVAA